MLPCQMQWQQVRRYGVFKVQFYDSGSKSPESSTVKDEYVVTRFLLRKRLLKYPLIDIISMNVELLI